MLFVFLTICIVSSYGQNICISPVGQCVLNSPDPNLVCPSGDKCVGLGKPAVAVCCTVDPKYANCKDDLGTSLCMQLAQSNACGQMNATACALSCGACDVYLGYSGPTTMATTPMTTMSSTTMAFSTTTAGACWNNPNYSCLNGGQCVINGNQASCVCNTGFCGTRCETSCTTNTTPSPTPGTTSGTCKDGINPNTGVSDCPSMKSYCNDPDYYDFMTKQCPVTCQRGCYNGGGGGTTVGGTPATTANPGCQDKTDNGVSNCAQHANLCQDPNYVQFMKDECPKTCGYC